MISHDDEPEVMCRHELNELQKRRLNDEQDGLNDVETVAAVVNTSKHHKIHGFGPHHSLIFALAPKAWSKKL